jgi:hypothetical protein
MKKRLVVIFTSILSFLLIFVGVRAITADTKSYNKRMMWTIISLGHLRSSIKEFKNAEERYPSSLAELYRYGEKNDDFQISKGHRLEYISNKEGRSQECRVKNGNGGWCYNSETGAVHVNITKPVREYFPFYFGKHRNEIPSDW